MLTQPSWYRRPESILLADDKDPQNWIQVVTGLYIYAKNLFNKTIKSYPIVKWRFLKTYLDLVELV